MCLGQGLGEKGDREGAGLFVRESFTPLQDMHLLQPLKGTKRSFPLVSPIPGVIYPAFEPRSCFHTSVKC